MTLRFPVFRVGAAGAALLGALAALWSVTAVSASAAPLASPRGPVAHGVVVGSITDIAGASFLLQTPGRQVGVVNALISAANRINNQNYPYVYGGGHAHAGQASVGIPGGSGYNGHRRGYDCSGSVAAVLAGAGLWTSGSGVPADNGVIAQLRSEHLIARGVGHGPVEVTLYDDPGVHIFMNINGRFFGTSDGGGGANSRGGAGWLNDGAPDASAHWYHPFHFRRSVLNHSTGSGETFMFQAQQLALALGQLQTGETLRVSYTETRSGAMNTSAISFPGSSAASGNVTLLGTDSFTIQLSDGSTLTFSTGYDPALLQVLALGQSVQVIYTDHGTSLDARLVSPTGSSPSGSGWGSGG